MNYIRLIFLCLALVTTSVVYAQSIQVQGTVTSSEDKEPLIGVSIKVKGATQGVITDIDGKYSIVVKPDDVLTFSYIGYNPKEESVRNRTNINIELIGQENTFEEVVVMGYSSQKKSELSSSLVTLKADELNDVTTSDIGNMLQGKAAGVMISNASGQPGAAAEIRIRGTGSITAQADPLYVVDGIPYGSFNPNDVETITVLKDAGATALYGSAAAGGVIIVTTKQAARNQPTQINLKATYGQKKALQGNYKMMSGAELYDTHKQIFSPTLFPLQRPEVLRSRNFDWLDAAFDTGYLQNYYISASGSSDKMNYFASVDYYKEDGTLINTNFDKISSRLNLNTKLASNVDMSIRVNYSQSKNREASSYMTSEGGYSNIPWDIPYDAEGNIIKIDSDIRPDNGEKWYTQDKRNFLHSEEYNYAKNKSKELVADFQINWNILDWLMFTTSNRFSTGGYKYTRYVDPRTYDPEFSNGYLLQNIGESASWNTSNLLKANHTFGKHSLSGLIGWEYGTHNNEYTSTSGTGMPNGIDALGAATPHKIDGYSYDGGGWSLFSQAQYNFLDRYFLTASIRADASSTFGKENRTGYFPSVAGSWLISNEEFLKNLKYISFLKLRASYGVTGNSSIGSFRSLATYDLNSSYQNLVGAYPERLANPQLTWESAHMTGLGFDISFLNRFHLNFDLYNIENKDLLLAVPKSPSTGFFDRTENAGSVRNQGLEVQISSDNIKTKDFLWNTTFNIGFNKNKVVSLPDHNPFIQVSGSSSIYQQVKEGQDIYSWYMPKWLGVDYENGDPLWEKLIKDANGNVIGKEATSDYAQADLQVVGKATPKFSGGFTNTLKYKGVGLHMTANFVYGSDIYNTSREQYDSDGAYLGYNMMKLKSGWNRWTEPGDIATHPKLAMNGNKNSNKTSSRYLEDGSFLRIRNITLSYDLPQRWLDVVKMKACKVYVSGDNLFTFTNFSGMDPEVSLKSTTWSLAGVYNYSYPISRQFLIGIDIRF
ncbi:TonB-dependent receptor [Dysgonomonas sp. BGC7]|uniref:SusC/RagA family TonB-linked outer membrane protein n=1 Tax=Dysgonomonas sp. BGC7 TaxID=1658008 RepID=UPI0009E3D16A|nr:TonB-dependent receptor [Dysgonomonas sp. BGC7]MBD8388577.1 TonB-dependent receptor [Dysgonomonas sp. BGC7]